jgi:hypothetical protein
MSSSNSQVSSLDAGGGQADEAQKPAAPKREAHKVATTGGATKPPFEGASGKLQTITIHPTSEEGGGDAVPVSINGYMYQIPRGKPVAVPVEVVEILRNAKTTHYTAKEGGGSVSRESHRFALTIEA